MAVRNSVLDNAQNSIWAQVARDVRSSLAACAVDLVNCETQHLTNPDSGEITAQIWGGITDLMYPTKETNE